MNESTSSNGSYLGARRFCDVILKGGVTSGVVYPRAICKLADTFVFRNVAGTSVGAIAAALTAAAEYDRQQHASSKGFKRLAELPTFLGKVRLGKSNLLHQFSADGGEASWQLDAALKLVGTAPLLRRLLRFELALALWYWPVWAVVSMLLVGLIAPWDRTRGLPLRVALGICIGGASTAAVLPVLYVFRVLRTLERNAFGWCHGHRKESEATTAALSPLSDWLADEIDLTAGLKLHSSPLTFGMLERATWNGEFGPKDGAPTITAKMVTTALTLQQPYTLPFDASAAAERDSQPPFYWSVRDFEKYFPSYVVTYLKKNCDRVGTTDYFRFPAAERLPLIVAARMSLSFPVLLCAVPLYAPDSNGQLKRVWFSDGGLSSNLPIHLFDAPLPRWPTFAFDLLGTEVEQKPGADRLRRPQITPAPVSGGKQFQAGVFIESSVCASEVEPWERLDNSDTRGDVLAFFSAILDTTRTWRDRLLGRLPGYSDRTVGVRLAPSEGGLNLNMSDTTIGRLAQYGENAAALLVDQYAPAPSVDSDGWIGHRWTRYCSTMVSLRTWLDDFTKGFDPYPNALPWQRSYDDLILNAVGSAPGKPTASPPESAAGAFKDSDAQIAYDETLKLAKSRLFKPFEEVAPHPHAKLGPSAPF